MNRVKNFAKLALTFTSVYCADLAPELRASGARRTRSADTSAASLSLEASPSATTRVTANPRQIETAAKQDLIKRKKEPLRTVLSKINKELEKTREKFIDEMECEKRRDSDVGAFEKACAVANIDMIRGNIDSIVTHFNKPNTDTDIVTIAIGAAPAIKGNLDRFIELYMGGAPSRELRNSLDALNEAVSDMDNTKIDIALSE